MTNRIFAAIHRMRSNPLIHKLDGEPKLNISFHEWTAYNDARASAQAGGVLNHEKSSTLYAILGSTYNAGNGGWSDQADTAAIIQGATPRFITT